jgi:hypothetical protein
MSWAWSTSRLEKVCAMAIYIASLDHLAEIPLWVDREQMELFMNEYERSSDQQQLLSDRQKQLAAIRRVRLIYFSFYVVSLNHF